MAIPYGNIEGSEPIDEFNRYPEGLILHDFLNQGHEFWGELQRRQLEEWLGSDPDWDNAISPDWVNLTGIDIDDMLTYFSDLGFVPVYFGPVESRTPTEYNAAESWDNTIPADLNN